LNLVEALVARGDEVTCLVRRNSQVERLRQLGVTLADGDVTQQDTLQPAVRGAEVVYHLAGCTKTFHREQFYRVNEQGVHNVAQTCAEQTTPPVLVVVSSLAAVGPAPDGRARVETDPLHPVSEYGRSKLAGERAAQHWASRLPITVVRPPIVIGPWDRGGLKMFKVIDRSGLHVVTGLGRARFSLLHAEDLAAMLILAGERGARLSPHQSDAPEPSQGYYFAAGNEHPTYAELGRMIGAALGRRVLIVRTPPRSPWVVAAVVEVISRLLRRPAYLNLDKAREIRAGSWLCSPQKAADELSFTPAAPLQDRLEQTAGWYREEGWL
jgi:nucleoside-diphosphate-sugar epimerase